MGFVLLHSLAWEWQRDLNNKKIIRILMSIIYLLPLFAMGLFAHSDNSIPHYHYAEYLIYLAIGIITFNILRIFIRRNV